MRTDVAGRTRQQILSAAEEIVHERGLRSATTRAIAERAGCAEGTIFRYFPDRNHLFMEIVKGRYPHFIEQVTALPDRVGKATVSRNLEEVARAALTFYRALVPIASGIMAERELMEAQRRHFEEEHSGPVLTLDAVAAYVQGEQRLGRVSGKALPPHVARLLLGACFSQAFIEHLVGPPARLGTDEQFARETVRTLTEGLLRPAALGPARASG